MAQPVRRIGSTIGVLRIALLCTLVLGLCAARAWDTARLAASARLHGALAVEGVHALEELGVELLAADELTRLTAINRFFNQRIAFREDSDLWGQRDYWASPLETLGKGAGDCEDFVIAKYFTLLTLGVPAHKMRLVYVNAMTGGPAGISQAHMVLAYYATPASEPLVLDNLLGDIRPASRRPDLTPVFSFNSEGLWRGTSGNSAGDPAARLSRWRDVLAKARDEGFL
jgi:predicted transglutaminase-like cysteine proteinase